MYSTVLYRPSQAQRQRDIRYKFTPRSVLGLYIHTYIHWHVRRSCASCTYVYGVSRGTATAHSVRYSYATYRTACCMYTGVSCAVVKEGEETASQRSRLSATLSSVVTPHTTRATPHRSHDVLIWVLRLAVVSRAQLLGCGPGCGLPRELASLRPAQSAHHFNISNRTTDGKSGTTILNEIWKELGSARSTGGGLHVGATAAHKAAVRQACGGEREGGGHTWRKQTQAAEWRLAEVSSRAQCSRTRSAKR